MRLFFSQCRTEVQHITPQAGESFMLASIKRLQRLCRRFKSTKSTNIWLICQHRVCQKIFPNSWSVSQLHQIYRVKNHKTGSRIFQKSPAGFCPCRWFHLSKLLQMKRGKLLSQTANRNIFKAYWVLLDRWNVCNLVKQLHNINTSTALF